jgi:transposase
MRHGNHPHPSEGRRQCKAAKKIDQPLSRTCECLGEFKGGRPPVDAEKILLAVLFRLREGCSWRALSIFAPHTTIYTRWKSWCESGVWDKILDSLASSAVGKLWAIDSTCAKVHKHAFGGPQGVEMQGIGRSKGGSNTKIHALVDARGRALRIILGAGNRHDSVTAPELVVGHDSRTILADKAYGSAAFRQLLESLGLEACIPPKANESSPAKYHKGFYKKRHHVENFFQRIKESRAIATRFEKLGARFLDLVKLAAICDWLKK